MKIRAKVRVQSKLVYGGYQGARGYETVSMTPVSASEIPEDKRFAEATPSGELKLNMKPEVADRFEFGKEYYVDFTPVAESDSAE